VKIWVNREGGKNQKKSAKRHDLQRQVTLLLKAMIDAALTQRRKLQTPVGCSRAGVVG